MQTKYYRQIAPKECPYTLDGRNLAEVRRFKIERIAGALDVPIGGKNEMLALIIAKLNSVDAEKELSSLPKKEQPKKASKKKAKK